jgi:hypothetical protein
VVEDEESLWDADDIERCLFARNWWGGVGWNVSMRVELEWS